MFIYTESIYWAPMACWLSKSAFPLVFLRERRKTGNEPKWNMLRPVKQSKVGREALGTERCELFHTG